MKLMWVCARPLKHYSNKRLKSENYLGSWLDGISMALLESFPKIEFSCCFIANEKEEIRIDSINYYGFMDVPQFRKAYESFAPDIVHFFGTENILINNCMKEIPLEKRVVSIQGIISECAKVYDKGIGDYYKIKNPLQSFIFGLVNQYNKNSFKKSGLVEIECFKENKNFIGRSNWDRKIVASFSNIHYFSCEEILRSSFYISKKWNFKNRKEKVIFMSQGSYPIKGTHYALEILRQLKLKGMNVKLRIAGENILNNSSLPAKLGASYSSYIYSMIKSFDLIEAVEFIGQCDEFKIIENLLECDMFLLPSLLENSPNSLFESMYLGVPSVCSNVGGIPTFYDGKNCLLFDLDSIPESINQICDILLCEDISNQISKAAIEYAEEKFSRQRIVTKYYNIYKEIVEGGIK